MAYFLLLMACLCYTSKHFVQENLMMEFKTLKTDIVFFLVFVINSTSKSRNMIFWKRTCKIEMMINPEL